MVDEPFVEFPAAPSPDELFVALPDTVSVRTVVFDAFPAVAFVCVAFSEMSPTLTATPTVSVSVSVATENPAPAAARNTVPTTAMTTALRVIVATSVPGVAAVGSSVRPSWLGRVAERVHHRDEQQDERGRDEHGRRNRVWASNRVVAAVDRK